MHRRTSLRHFHFCRHSDFSPICIMSCRGPAPFFVHPRFLPHSMFLPSNPPWSLFYRPIGLTYKVNPKKERKGRVCATFSRTHSSQLPIALRTVTVTSLFSLLLTITKYEYEYVPCVRQILSIHITTALYSSVLSISSARRGCSSIFVLQARHSGARFVRHQVFFLPSPLHVVIYFSYYPIFEKPFPLCPMLSCRKLFQPLV